MRSVLLVSLAIGVVPVATAQPCAPFTTDDFEPEAYGLFRALTTSPDGSTLYAGGIVFSGASKVIAWDGRAWAPVGGHLSETPNTMIFFDDGEGPALHAAGFSGIGHIRRLEGGTWTPLGGDPGGDVQVLFDYDGTLLAGGDFGVKSWNGLTWSSLGGSIGRVFAIETFGSPPALYAGTTEAVAGSSLLRLEGNEWVPEGGDLGVTSAIYALRAWDDGSGPVLFVGGGFEPDGGERIILGRWDGTSWTTISALEGWVDAFEVWDPGDGPQLVASLVYQFGPLLLWDGQSVTEIPNDLLVQSARDLAVYDAGNGPELFTASAKYPGVVTRSPERRWHRLFDHVDGACGDAPFIRGLAVGGPPGAPVMLATGSFSQAGSAEGEVAAWDGTTWHGLGDPDGDPELCGHCAILEHDDGDGPTLFVSGEQGVYRRDGETWTQIGATDGAARALITFDDGQGHGPALYAGGMLTTIGGVAVSGLARWDGAGWTAPGLVTGGAATISQMAVFDDGAGEGPGLYVAGSFTAINGMPAGSLARFDGSSWTTVDGGVAGDDGWIHALEVYDDGDGPALYAGGSFTSAGGVFFSRIARWRGAWIPLPVILDKAVTDMEVFDDGLGPALYLWGPNEINGMVMPGLGVWDGEAAGPFLAGSFHLSDPEVLSLLSVEFPVEQGGPSFFLAGSDLQPTIPPDLPFLARIRGCTDAELADVNMDGIVDALDLQALLADWGACGDPCPADTNGDGVVDALDLLHVLGNWTGFGAGLHFEFK